MDYKRIAAMIYDSTYIQNVNTGQVVPPDYLGASSIAGVVARTNPLYNSPSTLHADMTLSQSNPYNPKQAKVI